MPCREWMRCVRRSRVRGWLATWDALAVRFAMLRRATPRKLANLLAVKLQKRLRTETVRGRPYRYKIDPSSECRLSCPLCPTGRGELGRPRGLMDPGLFAKLVDEIAPHALVLDLFGWGEPLLHPELPRLIRQATSRGVFTRVVTALPACGRDQAEALTASGLDAIVVAVDGASPSTHALYRRGGRLDDVLAGVRNLLAARRRMGSRTPHLTLRMLVHRRNEHEIDAVRALSAELGADAFTVTPVLLDPDDAATASAWRPRDRRLDVYAHEAVNHGSCDDLWEAMIVNADGRTSPCCWCHEERHDLGDPDAEGIASVWNAPAYRAARRAAAGRAARPGDPAVRCSDCRGHPDYLRRANPPGSRTRSLLRDARRG